MEIKERHYPSGELLSSIGYDEGLKQGAAKIFAKNGQILSERFFDKDLEEGTHLYYYSNGDLKSQIPYNQGRLHGDVRLYYPGGVLKRSSHYQRGKREGKEILYYMNGSPLLEAEYQEDKPVGRAVMWYPEGTISKQVSYFTPGVIAEIQRWDASGKLIQDQEEKRDYIDLAVLESLHLQNSIVQMADSLQKIAGPLEGDLEEKMKQFKELSAKLLESSGLGTEGKEAIWKTAAHEKELHTFLQGITSPMQESMLKLQWHLRSMIQKMKKDV